MQVRTKNYIYTIISQQVKSIKRIPVIIKNSSCYKNTYINRTEGHDNSLITVIWSESIRMTNGNAKTV